MAHVDRLYLLGPLMFLAGFGALTVAVYATLCAVGKTPATRGAKHNELLGPFWGRYVVWLLGPVERLLMGRVSPNTITAASLLACIGVGVTAGLGHLAAAVWLFTAAGLLDILDGRIARITNRQTRSGALLDSVSDRWGELVALGGYAWYLRESPWLLAALLATGTSMMVSYTRARGEGLGLDLRGGIMQRAERVILVCIGTTVAAWVAANPNNAGAAVTVLGVTMAVCGAASAATAFNRWLVAFRLLSKQDAVMLAPAPLVAPAAAKAAAARAAAGPAVTPPSAQFVPVPKALRESAELGL